MPSEEPFYSWPSLSVVAWSSPLHCVSECQRTQRRCWSLGAVGWENRSLQELTQLDVCFKCCAAASCSFSVARCCTMLNVTSICIVTTGSAEFENGKSWNLGLPGGERLRVRFLIGALLVITENQIWALIYFKFSQQWHHLVNAWPLPFCSFSLSVLCLLSKSHTLIS